MQRKTTTLLVFILAGLALTNGLIVSQEGLSEPANDQVLSYYWKRADATLTSRDPLQRGVAYSFVATTYYQKVGKKGKPEFTDSSKAKYFYSFGNLDSTKTLLAFKSKAPAPTFDYPNVFHDSYFLTAFPNDTGGQMIAVGFDSDSSAMTMPTGLTVIDRQLYYPRWLYLYYPHKEGFRRFSRSYRFTLRDGFVFPDSVWEVGTRTQIFSVVTYRLETRVDSLTVYRGDGSQTTK